MQPSSEDDTQLIAKVRRGDREAYRFLVEAHQDRVYRVCLHTLSDRTQAEDLAQDTFTRAYQKLDQFDAAKGTFLVWILTIARRISINALKKRTPLTLNHVPETISASKDRPDAHASRSDTLAALDDALRKLSDDHRRAFVLAEIEELSHGEIARIEGITVGTVKSRISRAKQMLQGRIQPIYEEINDLT